MSEDSPFSVSDVEDDVEVRRVSSLHRSLHFLPLLIRALAGHEGHEGFRSHLVALRLPVLLTMAVDFQMEFGVEMMGPPSQMG